MTEPVTPAPRPPDLKLRPGKQREAIPHLKALIAELRQIDPSTIQERGEERFDVLEEKIVTTVADLVGSAGAEHFGLCRGMLDAAPVHMMYEMPLYRVRTGYKQGIEQAIARLRNVIEEVENQLSGEHQRRGLSPIALLEELDPHPGIRKAAAEHIRAGNYSQALAEAATFLEELVKERSGKHSLSGPELVAEAFSLSDPTLACNALVSDADQQEQRGIMNLLSGTLLALRNPRAAERIGSDAEQAIGCLAFISFLAAVVEQARQV